MREAYHERMEILLGKVRHDGNPYYLGFLHEACLILSPQYSLKRVSLMWEV